MIIVAIILGIIEGLTEFLPISSTGHLILANNYLSFEGPFANLFSIVIQSGAILAVIIYFRDKIFPVSYDKPGLKNFFLLWTKVLVGIIPAGILGVLFSDLIKEKLFYPVPVAITLIGGALLIILVETKVTKVKYDQEDELTYRNAFIIGVFQLLALIPGMSRSASTIIGGRVLGYSRRIAAEFSFFLAIPTLLGAGLLELLDTQVPLTQDQWTQLGVGTLVSFITAYLVIAFFMNYIKKHDFKLFAYYRIILGALVLIFA